MKTYTFDDIRKEGLLIYEYIMGSHAYGLQKPDGTSDIDTAGVYLEPIKQVLGLGLDFQEQIVDEKHDNVWWSLKKFMNLLCTSNPAVLESLFIPEDKILYEHPIMTEIKKHRDLFVTKACFKSFLGYGKSQIMKARGLNKKIVNPVTKRLEPLDFAYTFYKQGSSNIKNWLEYRGLKQEYCGLVAIPNMFQIYGVYYDWGAHFEKEGVTTEMIDDSVFGKRYDIKKVVDAYKENPSEENDKLLKSCQFDNMVDLLCNTLIGDDDDCFTRSIRLTQYLYETQPLGYKGMVGEDGRSTSLRLSSVAKGETPICHMSYNELGYKQHCTLYKEYKQWEKDRNPERYKENCEKDFDRKNMAHAVRLMHMGIEIAKTGRVNVDRTNIDRDFILGIRLGDTTYDDIIKYLQGKEKEMREAMEKSTLPEEIDKEVVNNLLLKVREGQMSIFSNKAVIPKETNA